VSENERREKINQLVLELLRGIMGYNWDWDALGALGDLVEGKDRGKHPEEPEEE